MIGFTIEFFCGLLIGLVIGPLLTPNQLYIIIQAIKLKTIKLKSQIRQPLRERKYLLNVKYLWKDFEPLLLFIKRPELDSVFFNKVDIKFHKSRERKSVIAFILKGQFSRKTIEALKKWVDKEKEKENEDVNSIYNNI